MEKYAYDVEVLRGPDEVEGGWDNPEGMGFGTGVVFYFEQNRYYFFNSNGKEALIDLMMGGKVISFNGVKFDNRVIFGNDYNSPNCERAWLDVDLLLEVVMSKFGVSSVQEAEEKFGNKTVHDGSIGLNGLALGTLGMQKTGHGANAPLLIRQGRWAEVYAYNLHDVRLTVLLYDFAKHYGYLVDGNENKIVIPKGRL